jgi:hypothetical protein
LGANAAAAGVSQAVAQQRVEFGVRGAMFGPNLGSVDYAELFAHPETWADLRNQLSAYKIYGDNVHADAPSDRVGTNTYPAFCAWELFGQLRQWNLPVHLEHGAIKEWETEERPPGEVLRDLTITAITRIRNAGGEVNVVCMDEPLWSKINPGGDQGDPRKWGVDQVGDLARFTAAYIHAVRDQGPSVALIEAYPHHSASRIVAFLRHIVDDHHEPLAFFEVDLDVWDVKLKELTDRQVRADFQLFRETCRERDIPLRFIATGTHARSAKEYRDETFDIVRRMRRHGVPLDGVTVQSWTEHDTRREIPPNLPRTDSTSHLAILADVLDAQWDNQAPPKRAPWTGLVETLTGMLPKR